MGVGQKYNLAKLFSLSRSQLLFVEFLFKKFSMLARRQGWLGLKEAI